MAQALTQTGRTTALPAVRDSLRGPGVGSGILTTITTTTMPLRAGTG